MKSWLISIIAAAILIAICETIVPDGGVKRVMRTAGTVVLMLLMREFYSFMC